MESHSSYYLHLDLSSAFTHHNVMANVKLPINVVNNNGLSIDVHSIILHTPTTISSVIVTLMTVFI